MAFMVNGDTVIFDDFPTCNQTDLAIDFDEIKKLAEESPEYDNSKLLQDPGTCVGLAPPYPGMMDEPPVLDPAPPRPITPRQHSPEAQPPLRQASGEDSLLYAMQSAKLNDHILQPATLVVSSLQSVTPMESFLQPAAPGVHYSGGACSPQPFIPESTVPGVLLLPSTGPALPSYSVQQQEGVMGDAARAPTKGRGKSKGPRKPKAYEQGPLEDKVAEKKRLSAINAKKHRDNQKAELAYLARELEEVTHQRDSLMQQVKQLMQREAQLRQMLANQGIPMP